MNGPGMILLGLGALGLNVFVGILIWLFAFRSGAVGAAAQAIDRAVREGRANEPVERKDNELR